MSSDAAAGTMNFTGGFGAGRKSSLLSVFPLSNIMHFPDAERLSRVERDRNAENSVTGGDGASSGQVAGRVTNAQEGSMTAAADDTAYMPYMPSSPALATGAPQPVAATAMLSSADQDRAAAMAALQGNQQAFADLVNRYQSAVYNMAYRMLGDPTEAEDAAQEVFVRAWNQLHTFQMDRRFSTWLLSIASHYCIDLLRRRKPTAPLDDVALFVESNDPAPEEIAMQGEQRDSVQRLLNTLPEKYRSVTVLRYFNDLSYDEIARMTGLTESAVKTQLHRARRMLAEQISAKGGTTGELQGF